MSIWNKLLPHRQLVNSSLRKASANLRSHIDKYKIDYELQINRCTAEIEQAYEKKDSDFEEVKLSLLEEFSKDADLFDEVLARSLVYVDLFLRCQCLYRVQEAKKLETKSLMEYIEFLTSQMSLIGEEIDILEKRKDKLSLQAKVEDVKELLVLTENDIPTNQNDDAVSLLAKVAELLSSIEISDRYTRQALLKLRSMLQERVDLLPLIQYISWMILQKKTLSAQLKEDRQKARVELKVKKNELVEISENINELGRLLEDQARTVREYWSVPITQLNIQISFLYKRLNSIFAEVKEIGERIEHMKRIGSDDSFTWDNLWLDKNNLKEQIPQVEQEIVTLKAERQQWFGRQQMLFSLFKKNNIYLLSDGKEKASDEYRIIDTRLSELYQIESDANLREEERFKREAAQIEQARKMKVDELSNLIESAEKAQAEKNADLSQASKALSISKSHDTRFFLLKLFSEPEEITRTKLTVKAAKAQKKTADTRVATIKKELAEVIASFDKQMENNQPRPYRPSSAESEEKDKLEVRRAELLDPNHWKKNKPKGGRLS